MVSVVTKRIWACLVFATVIAVGSVSAHHSQSAYDPTRTITIEGTLLALSWANPHSLFVVNARPVDTPNAPLQRWSVEGPAPRALEGFGWTRTDAKVGEKVQMTGRPRRDGKPDMLVVGVVTAAGKKISFRNDAGQ